MIKPHMLRLASLACLASLCTQSHAALTTQTFQDFADGSSLASMVELGQLRYTLIDLAPDDGVTPWISFERNPSSTFDLLSVAFGAIDRTGAAQMETITGIQPRISTYGTTIPSAAFPNGQSSGLIASPDEPWLPDTALIATSSDGLTSAQLGGNSLTASARITADGINQYKQMGYAVTGSGLEHQWALEASAASVTGGGGTSFTMYENIDPTTGEVTQTYGGLVYGEGATSTGGWPNGYQFSLSPNTQVLFEGTITAYTSSNLAGLEDLGLSELDVLSRSYAGVGLVRLQPQDGRTFWMSESDLRTAYDLQIVEFAASNNATVVDEAPHSLDFQLSLSNTASESIEGRLHMYAGAEFSAYGSVVPEPGTWALMGLGLLGIAAAARRQAPRR